MNTLPEPIKSITDFVFGIDLPSLLIGWILSAVIAIWLDFYIKQPKLRVTGGGSGRQQDGTRRNNMTLTNEVGWFGINIPETRIFGVRIHPTFRWGQNFEKNVARECRAHLHLAENNEFIGQLWWQSPDGSVQETATIRSGDSANLILFARPDDNSCSYFAYHPLDRQAGTTLIPDPSIRFIGTREFYIRINYGYNKVLIQRLKIEQTHTRLLYLKTPTGSSIF